MGHSIEPTAWSELAAKVQQLDARAPDRAPSRRGSVAWLQRYVGNRAVAAILTKPEGHGFSPAASLLQRQQAPASSGLQQQESGSGAAPSADDVWSQIEPRAVPELLIKLQEINRAAANQTRDQIDELFGPYEESLESDQTFLAIAGLPLSAAGNVPQSPGWAGIAAAVTDGTKLVMQRIMDFKSVGDVKRHASGAIADAVDTSLTSDSPTYMNFETEALNGLRTDFEASWARVPPDQKNLSIAVPLYTTWFQMEARARYGANSADGQSMLSGVREQVAKQLDPVKQRLEQLKADQHLHRIEAGALGAAVAGGTIGAFVGGPVGAGIGAAIGGIVGAIGGALW